MSAFIQIILSANLPENKSLFLNLPLDKGYAKRFTPSCLELYGLLG